MSEAPSLPVELEGHPSLRPFLPILLAAWTTRTLTPSEVRHLVDAVERAPSLTPDDVRSVREWLSPERPPPPEALESLRAWVRARADSLDPGSETSLAELGYTLAAKEWGAREASGGEGGSEEGPGREGAPQPRGPQGPPEPQGREGVPRPRDREGTPGPDAPEALRGVLQHAEEILGVAGHEAARELLGRKGPPGHGPPDALFEPSAMHRFLEGDRMELRQEVLDLLTQPAFRFDPELPRDRYRERVLEAVGRLAEEGLGVVGYPPEHGGRGDVEGGIVVFETLALGDLSVLTKFGVQFGLFGGSIQQLGSGAHHGRYLEPVGRLELPGCFAMTEVDHGSNVRELQTEARYDPERQGFVIHTPHPGARKDWIGNAALHGRMATVFARLTVGDEDHGVHAFLVPLRGEDGAPLPGVEIEDSGAKVGLNGVDNGRIAFHRVVVPRENLLDRFAQVREDGRYTSPIPSAGKRFFTMLGTLVMGRISVAAAAVNVAKRALTVAVRYSHRRRQFGPTGGPEARILDFRAQQRLLLPRLAAAYGHHFAVRDLRRHYAASADQDPGSPARREVEGLAAGLKAEATRHALATVQAGREACGGEGYRASNRFGVLRRDADVFTTFEGSNVVLLQLLARGLLTEYREEMGDLRFWDTVRYLADRASVGISQRNPVITRRSDEAHLRDPDFHRDAFLYREARLLRSAGQRLRHRIEGGMDSFDAMNETQDHLIHLARSHVERRVVESFHEAVAGAPSPGLSEVLRTLAQLYALERLEADASWFLEAGYMEGQKTRAIRSLVNDLSSEIREQALFLVDGFGIPDEVLQAPAGAREPAGDGDATGREEPGAAQG